MKKKILSIMLSLALVLAMTPMMGGVAYAEGTWSNLHWEATEACWDEYEGADSYWVYLYKDGTNPYGSGFGTSDTRIDFEEQMLLEGTGEYIFYVVPHFNGEYHDDLRSGNSMINIYIAPELDLSAPVNLRWNKNTAEWDASQNAMRYIIDLYKDGELAEGDIPCGDSTEINLTSKMEKYGAGSYTFKVASKAVGKTGEFSAESPVLNYTLIPVPGNLHWEGNVAKWDAVQDAEDYWIRIYREDAPLYAGRVYTNEYDLSTIISNNGCAHYSFAVAAYVNGGYGRDSEKSEINDAHLLNSIVTPATFTADGVIESKCTNTGCTYKNKETIPAISSVALSEDSYTYNGTVRNPSLIVKDREGKVLTEGTDYTVSVPEGRKAVGTYTYSVEFIGNYSGSENVSFTIGARSIEGYSVTLSQTSYTYDGSAKEPKVSIDGLTEGTDYTVAYSNNVNAGTATVTITGKGNYTGTITKNFTIEGRSISGYNASLSQTSYAYDGSAKKPTVTIDGLAEGTDFTVAYSGNVNAGTAAVTITGKGNYTGSITKNFTIEGRSIAGYSAKLGYTSYTYSGSAKKPKATVAGLTSGTDYTVEYSNNINVGTATAVITGIGNYSGTITKTYTIKAKSISGKTPTLTASSFAYAGKALKPAVTISGLKSGSDFTAKYTNNTKVGKATITINGKGNYTGSLTKTFNVVPKQAAVKSLTSGKKKLTVKMTAKPSSKAGTTYQIGYKKKGTSTWKYTTTTSSSKTIKSLKKGKTYYVKVRAYKTVNKVKYYGAWSATKLSKKVK